MAKYIYKALDKSGGAVGGSIEAESEDRARERLGVQGLMVESLAEKVSGSSLSWASFKAGMHRVGPEELVIFTKQLGTMLRAGVPILRGLDILEQQSENPTLKSAAKAIAGDIKDGASLSEALKKYPQLFPSLYCSMVRAGESSGSLPEVLDRLIYIMQHENKIKSDIRSALQYPLIVLVVLAVAFLVLVTFVIPQFANLFLEAKISLPLPTRIALGLHHVLVGYWMLTLGVLVFITLALTLFLKTRQGQYVRDSIFVRLPVFGPLLIKAAVSRFASIFSILQASGVPVLEAMRMLSGTIGNSAIARELDKTIPLLEEGRGISGPLQTVKFFPPILINMVAIGEESGSLDTMLKEVSTHYDAEVEYAMKRLSDAIAPALIILLAALVGFFALAVYMPIWDLSKVARSGGM